MILCCNFAVTTLMCLEHRVEVCERLKFDAVTVSGYKDCLIGVV